MTAAGDPFKGKGGALAITAVASMAAIAASIVRSKVAAVALGPEGVGTIAEVSQFVSFLAFPLAVASGPALVTALSRRADSIVAARRALQTAVRLSIVAGLLLALVSTAAGAVLFRRAADATEVLALIVLGASNAGLNAVLGVATAALIAIGKPDQSARVQVKQHLLSALIPSVATLALGIIGQLAGLFAALLVTIPDAFRRLWKEVPEFRTPRERFDWGFIRVGVVLGIAALFAAGTNQALYTVYRSLAHAVGGTEANGQLQAALSISSAYFSFVLSSLGAIALPACAAARDENELSQVIRSTLLQILKWVPPIILLSFAFCRPVIGVLYSGKFGPASEVLALQMAGDLPKAFAWALAGPLLVRGHVRAFIIGELIATVTLAVTASVLVPRLGLYGFGPSYVIGYSVAVLSNGIVLARAARVRIPWPMCTLSVGGAAVLVGASFIPQRLAVEVIAGAIGVVWAVRVGGLAIVRRLYARLSPSR